MCFGSSDKDYSSQPPRIHRVGGTGRYQFERFPNGYDPRGQERQRQGMPGGPFPPSSAFSSSGSRGPGQGQHNPPGHHGSSGRHHFPSASASRSLPDGPVPPRNPGDPAGWRYRGRMYYQRDPSDTSVDPRMNEPGWFFLHPGKKGGGGGPYGGPGRPGRPGGPGAFSEVPRGFPGMPGGHPGRHRGGGGGGGRRGRRSGGGGGGGRRGGQSLHGSQPGRGPESEFGRGY